MPGQFDTINTMYGPYGPSQTLNKKYTGASPIQQEMNQPPNLSNNLMDMTYKPLPENEVLEGGGMFEDLLGQGVNIYDPASIASSLTERYGLDKGSLTAEMFTAMPKSLMTASQASTYDSYKRLLSHKSTRKFRDIVASSAGMLNPNRKRARAKRAYQAGMGDIRRNIFAKTSMAREGVRDWLQSALAKVKRLKY
tara:strand:- start:2911 stop:3495 length:585 start_codon:yes stop_codon:yes gene_type:complete